MIYEIIVPKLGMAAAVVTLTEWKVKEGEYIEKDAALLDLEAEKSTFEMPAGQSGYVHILMEQGTETDVNNVVGFIAETSEDYARLQAIAKGDIASAEVISAPSTPPCSASSDMCDERHERIFITPVARRMARELKLDIASITGTGPRGRIQKADIEQAIAARSPSSTTSQISLMPQHPTVAPSSGEKEVAMTIPYRGMRKVIGENMMRSLAVNAPNTMSGDFDLTKTVDYRAALVKREAAYQTRITYAEILIWAVSRSLAQFPLMNSSLIDGEIRVWKTINVGMAVALGEHGEDGLVVPVIRDAANKSLVEISKEAKDLGLRARSNALKPEEMTGGTFTVSNFGSVGVSQYSTPIINVPESGILAVGRLVDKPVVRAGQIVVAPILPYSLTHDHRITDGAAAERFLSILKDMLENPGLNALAG